MVIYSQHYTRHNLAPKVYPQILLQRLEIKGYASVPLSRFHDPSELPSHLLVQVHRSSPRALQTAFEHLAEVVFAHLVRPELAAGFVLSKVQLSRHVTSDLKPSTPKPAFSPLLLVRRLEHPAE